MPRIIITAQVEDQQKWEGGFRTHGNIFREQAIISPYQIGLEKDGKHVAVSAEVTDLDIFFEILDSQVTAEAMAYDGILRETVKVFVLDREFAF